MSFVKFICIGDSTPKGDGDIEFANPSSEQIREGIASMDGHHRSYVLLFPTEEPGEIHLSIAGGTQGYFWVSHWNGVEGVQQDLVNPNASSDEEVALDLGEISRRKESELVDLVTAQRVATIYTQTGELAANMLWNRAS